MQRTRHSETSVISVSTPLRKSKPLIPLTDFDSTPRSQHTVDKAVLRRVSTVPVSPESASQSPPSPVIKLCFDSPPPKTTSECVNDRTVKIGSPDFSQYSTDEVIVPSTASKNKAARRPTYTFERTERTRSLLLKATYFTICLFWLGAYWNYQASTKIYSEMQTLLENAEHQTNESIATTAQVQLQTKEMQARFDQMSKMSHAFHHELRVIEDVVDGSVEKLKASSWAENSRVSKWVRQRKQALQHRVNTLKHHVQEQSKQSVLEKWGPGPYRVKFKVNVLYTSQENGFGSAEAKDRSAFTLNKGTRIKKDFVIELAPLEMMPHAIDLFLTLVESRLWDDSVFLHHDEAEHVMAVAPLDYKTHNLKSKELDSLPFKTMGFPEYSREHPHEKYTIGFANKGPTFYINTMDNSQHHGPGGQEHHDLPEDADPCFGTVVQGREVVDMLIGSAMQPDSRINTKADHPWNDHNDLFWTRIVSVDIQS